MTTKLYRYHEQHSVRLNNLLLFFVFVTMLLVVVNVCPVSRLTYGFSFMGGLVALLLLCINPCYHVTIKGRKLTLSLGFLVKFPLLTIDISQIAQIIEIPAGADRPASPFRNVQAKKVFYLVKTPAVLKLTTSKDQVYIFATRQPARLVEIINKIKMETAE